MKSSLKAMVMSAGIGSRLEPLTLDVPKPLIPVANKPVMDILFENLAYVGITDVICNTYYLAEQIIKRYKNNKLGINFNYITEETLSGTAGGVKKCQFFFDKNEPFLVLSADGLTNADIQKGIEIHKNSNAIATIGIKQIKKEEVSNFGVVVTDKNGFITEFQEKPSVKDAKSNFINTGIYIFDYKIFDYIPENTFYDFAKNVFPKLLAEHAINTFEIKDYWSDIGTLEQYKQSCQDVFDGKCIINNVSIKQTRNGAYISATDKLDASLNFIGNSIIGKNVKIGKHAIIENSIIWDNVTIAEGIVIKNCVIGANCTISASISEEIIKSDSIFSKETVKI